MNELRFRCVAASLALLLAAAIPAAAGAIDPFEIDVLLPLTGSAAFYSIAQQQSLHIDETNVNRAGGIGGRPVKFVISDDQSDAKVDVQLANAIIA